MAARRFPPPWSLEELDGRLLQRRSGKVPIAGLVFKLPTGLGGKKMNLTASLAVLGVSLALLFFGRGRGGDALPMFRNWIVGMLFSIAILYFFFGGLMGVGVNLNLLH